MTKSTISTAVEAGAPARLIIRTDRNYRKSGASIPSSALWVPGQGKRGRVSFTSTKRLEIKNLNLNRVNEAQQ